MLTRNQSQHKAYHASIDLLNIIKLLLGDSHIQADNSRMHRPQFYLREILVLIPLEGISSLVSPWTTE